MSQKMRCKPSDIARITDPWLAYWWDEACYIVSLYEEQKDDAPKEKDAGISFGAYG